MSVKYDHHISIWKPLPWNMINSLPCKLVLENFVPEFNSGSHETKKMSTRWFLKLDIKFCHRHQSRGCLWDIIGHQILLNVITGKKTRQTLKNSSNTQKQILIPILCTANTQGRRKHHAKVAFCTWYPRLWEPGVLNFGTLLRTVVRTPSLHLSLLTPPNRRDLSWVTFPQAPLISDKLAVYRNL